MIRPMLAFFEAVTKIKKNALAAPSTADIVTGALKSYMRESDPYGNYLPPEAYRQWIKAQQHAFPRCRHGDHGAPPAGFIVFPGRKARPPRQVSKTVMS